MDSYEVGYGKPPAQHQFRKGVSGNPAGRRAKKEPKLASIVRNFLHEQTDYTECGRSKKAPRLELTVRRLFTSALRGDVAAAAQLLELRTHAERTRDGGAHIVIIENALPDDELTSIAPGNPT